MAMTINMLWSHMEGMFLYLSFVRNGWRRWLWHINKCAQKDCDVRGECAIQQQIHTDSYVAGGEEPEYKYMCIRPIVGSEIGISVGPRSQLVCGVQYWPPLNILAPILPHWQAWQIGNFVVIFSTYQYHPTVPWDVFNNHCRQRDLSLNPQLVFQHDTDRDVTRLNV